jgi:hypothetical protein
MSRELCAPWHVLQDTAGATAIEALRFDVDPKDEEAVNKQQSTYARWFKEGQGVKWRDVPAYLSDTYHQHTWRTMACCRLGNHGLGVEVGRHTGLPYSRCFC